MPEHFGARSGHELSVHPSITQWHCAHFINTRHQTNQEDGVQQLHSANNVSVQWLTAHGSNETTWYKQQHHAEMSNHEVCDFHEIMIPLLLSQPKHDTNDASVQWKSAQFLYLHSHLNYYTHTHTHKHTHTRLTALCPGLPGWAGTRKMKPIWILLKQETVSGRGICWAICKSAPRSRQITMSAPHRSVFYRPDALPVAQPTVSKHWKQNLNYYFSVNNQSTFLYLLTALGVAHLVVHGTTGSTSYEMIPHIRLETPGDMLSTLDMVV